MDVGIILAAGKGKRFKTTKINKTATKFRGKPLLEYAIELFEKYCDKTVVVIGAYADSLTELIKKYPNTITAFQKRRLGTGNAVKVAVKELVKKGMNFDKAFVGYGDHMMFYTQNDLQIMSKKVNKVTALGVATVEHDPQQLAWGRVIRNSEGNVLKIVEEKVANKKEKKVRELNAGFYCLDFQFLKKGISLIKKTPGGEYYFTDIVAIANALGKKVSGVNLPFGHVGIGVNTREELEESAKLFGKLKGIKKT